MVVISGDRLLPRDLGRVLPPWKYEGRW